MGFDTQGLETWESWSLTRGEESLTVQALPGVHARGLMGGAAASRDGLLEHRVGEEVRRRVYITGDTLTGDGDHVDEIARRHPDIDVAVVHLGGTRVLFHTVTMDAEQGVDLVRRARPRQVVPVHYDDYRVFRSPLSECTAAADDAGLGSLVRTVRRGETIDLEGARPPGSKS